MRMPKYLSPTSIALFYQSEEEFYLRYLTDKSPPKMPQTDPMAVGSAFDAHVKSYIYEKFYGKKDPAFELETILTAQVEPQNRDKAIEAGRYCFECYTKYGSLADLMLELDQASDNPRMEFKVEGRVTHDATVEGVPLSGKPDLYFKTRDGAHVIYDWKVNGYYGNGNTSPKPGYIMVRGDASFNKLNAPHKDAQIFRDKGIMLNAAQYLEHINDDWANQLSVYGWLMGEPVGGDFIVGIDQLVFSNALPAKPKCRIAAQRCRISATYQQQWFAKVSWVWTVLQSNHIFRGLSKEDSLARQTMLDNQFAAYTGDPTDKNEAWFKAATRQHSNY